jgi:hypothetical protein
MRVTLLSPNAQDELYLIKVEELMAIIDAQDLAQRKSETIEDAYHEHWLTQYTDGSYQFHAPEFYLSNGIVKFINGRHRTLLLGKHLKNIPMALTNMDGFPPFATKPSPESLEALAKISAKKLTGNEILEFPDLPIKYLGYDDNIEK